MLEDLKKIISCLKFLNIKLSNPKIDINFQSRLIIQKLSFICKSLGFNFSYRFNLYKFGPYSPNLTEDYYKYSNYIVNSISDYKLNTEEHLICEKIRAYLLSHPLNKLHQTDLFEAVATALFVKQYNSDNLDNEVFEKTKNEKPYLNDKTIIIAINIVKELLFKDDFLTKDLKEEFELWDNAED